MKGAVDVAKEEAIRSEKATDKINKLETELKKATDQINTLETQLFRTNKLHEQAEKNRERAEKECKELEHEINALKTTAVEAVVAKPDGKKHDISDVEMQTLQYLRENLSVADLLTIEGARCQKKQLHVNVEARD